MSKKHAAPKIAATKKPATRRRAESQVVAAPPKPQGRWVQHLDERFHKRMIFEPKGPS